MERFTWLARFVAAAVILFIFLLAADATSKRAEKPTAVQIQGPVRVDVPPQRFILEAPTIPPSGTAPKKDGANGKKGRGKG
jgi:hypothetical protein